MLCAIPKSRWASGAASSALTASRSAFIGSAAGAGATGGFAGATTAGAGSDGGGSFLPNDMIRKTTTSRTAAPPAMPPQRSAGLRRGASAGRVTRGLVEEDFFFTTGCLRVLVWVGGGAESLARSSFSGSVRQATQ
jgi:hypothetical protein